MRGITTTIICKQGFYFVPLPLKVKPLKGTSMEQEIWKQVRETEHIEVSNLGNVRRVAFVAKHKNRNCTYPDKPIAQHKNKDGYPCVQLYVKGKRIMRPVHRLVFEAFNGPCEHPFVIDHIDNDKTNNRLENLQKTTNRINTSKDRWRNRASDLPIGVYRNRDKFVAQSFIEGKRVYFGTFDTIDEAVNALIEKKIKRVRKSN